MKVVENDSIALNLQCHELLELCVYTLVILLVFNSVYAHSSMPYT